MTKLELSVEERDVLTDTLQIYLSNLSYEIANTDSMDFRDGLKHKREILSNILSMLQTNAQIRSAISAPRSSLRCASTSGLPSSPERAPAAVPSN
jgi:hypothetical protein